MVHISGDNRFKVWGNPYELLTEMLEAKRTCGLNFHCITLVCGGEIIMWHGIEFPKKEPSKNSNLLLTNEACQCK